jgi:hypothetical protein
MTPEQLAAWKRLAEAATPGPWQWRDSQSMHVRAPEATVYGPAVLCASWEYDSGSSIDAADANRAYIAHSSPDRVLALIAQVEAAERSLDEMESFVKATATIAAERDALTAQVERLTLELDEANTLYHDLLFQVGTKHPGETRHETARRYLNQHERHCNQGGPCAALTPPPAQGGRTRRETPPEVSQHEGGGGRLRL